MLEIRGIEKTYYEDRKGQSVGLLVLDGISFDVPGKPVRLPARRQRLRQDDAAAHRRRPDEADGGDDPGRGPAGHGPGQDRSMVFQNYGLLPWRTVMGNVEFGLEMRGVAKAERRAICQSHIDRVGLRRLREALPAPDLRRHAAAHGAGPRVLQGPRDPADGRAVRGGRRADARDAAGRAAEDLERQTDHRALRHPQHRGGGLPRRPRDGDGRAARPDQGRHRDRPAAPARTSPTSSRRPGSASLRACARSIASRPDRPR